MWQSNTVEVDSITFHYTRTGGSKPPLVLAHGITDNGLCWKSVAQKLESDYDVIMPDARGHGKSDAPETGYTWITFAQDVERVCRGLGLEKPFILGHSMGAISALLVAALYPDLPTAVLLEDPPPFWMNPTIAKEGDTALEKDFRVRLEGLKEQSRDELIALQKEATPHWSQTEIEMWADAKLQINLHILQMFRAQAHDGLDWENLLSQVTCPVLLIKADVEKQAIVTPEAADYVKKHIPQVQIEHVADAGHSIHRDQFDAYMTVVQSYLKQQ